VLLVCCAFDLEVFIVINYIECCSLKLWFQKYGGFIELIFYRCVVLKFDILLRHF
jgi:hypothetical protein